MLIALQNAFFELLHAASLEEAVVRTVRRGGDTDTNAAICGALLTRPELRAQMEAAAREAGAVASALGVDLAADPAELARAVARATASNRSSMLQDLERGQPTEVDALNGAVVHEARRLGLSTPVNERLWQAVLASGSASSTACMACRRAWASRSPAS